MRYKQDTVGEVRRLRKNGFSLGQIYETTGVPRTTIRTWIKDISLSKQQQLFLKQRIQKFLQNGRIRFQKLQKDKRLNREKKLLESGIKEIGKLSPREFLIAGIALYWAEGFKNKHEHRLGFCNSDPLMITFYINWLNKNLGISKNDIMARLTINESYTDEAVKIQEYWSGITGIPLSNFTKIFYQTSKWKKQYNTGNYQGVLRIHAKDSLSHLLKMKGWIEGLKMLK